jgi:hypothetical protein
MKYKMPTYHVAEGWSEAPRARVSRRVSPHWALQKKHPTIKAGKGGINLKPSDHLPVSDLRCVVRHAIENPKG